jgi:hypothetical protein
MLQYTDLSPNENFTPHSYKVDQNKFLQKCPHNQKSTLMPRLLNNMDFLSAHMSITEVGYVFSCKSCFISTQNVREKIWTDCKLLKKPTAEHSKPRTVNRGTALNSMQMVSIQQLSM